MKSPFFAAALSALLIGAAVQWSARPAAPVAASAPETAFSSERARPVLMTLVDEIGHRTAGSPGATRAMEYLRDTMAEIPGLEVEVQDVTQVADGPYSGPSIYRVRNVVARLPGRAEGSNESDEAVLLAAHYDSAPNSVGAADDALAVAAVVETARALAAGPRPWRSVVFLLDEGEELGLFGAQGFLHHRWAKDVVTFLNLEAAGSRGRPIVFQTGPGDPWLAGIYAANAPHPHGSVMGQDVFQSGVIPSDTDFRVYRDDGGLRGIDLALYRDGWAYHTHLDRTDRLEPGSLQEMGANTLAVVRGMAEAELPNAHDETPAVYYDVLGLFMITYSGTTGVVLALLSIVLVGHAGVRAVRRLRVQPRQLGSAVVWTSCGWLVGVVCGVLPGHVVGVLLERGGGWYARPWLAVLAFGPPALLYVIATLRNGVLGSRWSLESTAAALLCGVGLLLGSLTLVMLVFGLGSAYLGMWWLVGIAAALYVVGSGGRLDLACVLGFVPGALFTWQAADALVATFVPMAGRMPITMDLVVAGLVALPVATMTLVPGVFVTAFPPRRARMAAAALALVGVVACTALPFVMPYTAERPKRIWALAQTSNVDSTGALDRIVSMDGLAIDHPCAPVPALRPEDPGTDRMRQVGVEFGTDTAPEAGGGRRFVTRVDTHGAMALVVHFAPGSVREIAVQAPETDVSWQPAAKDGKLTFVAPPRAFAIEIEPTADSPLTLRFESRFTAPTETTRRQYAQLPPWVAPDLHVSVFSAQEN